MRWGRSNQALPALRCLRRWTRGLSSMSGLVVKADASHTAGVGGVFVARRIISLVPSATSTLHAIGAGEQVVGRTDFDCEEWVADRPSVGGGLEPNIDLIASLSPDLVIRFGGSDSHTATRLKAIGIRTIAVQPDHIQDIYETISILGQATGHPQEADSLTLSIKQGLEEVTASVADYPRLRIAYVIPGSPNWVAGPGYVTEVLGLLGGDNAFSDLHDLYSAVGREDLQTRQIDVVLLACAKDFDASLTAARVVEIGDGLETPGPGIIADARRAAALMHGRL